MGRAPALGKTCLLTALTNLELPTIGALSQMQVRMKVKLIVFSFSLLSVLFISLWNKQNNFNTGMYLTNICI